MKIVMQMVGVSFVVACLSLVILPRLTGMDNKMSIFLNSMLSGIFVSELSRSLNLETPTRILLSVGIIVVISMLVFLLEAKWRN